MKRFNLKLSHKVFLSMVLSAVVTLVGVQCTAQYLIHSHSRAQFGQRFFSRMIRFSSALEAVYASQGKWGTLEQPENWERFVSVTFPQTDLYRNVLSESQRYIFPSVMALLETDGNHLAGSAGMKEEYLCTPLYFQDEVVGYLGLRAFSVLFDLVEYDGSSDLWILLSVGIGILVISLVASYFLSRHLLEIGRAHV